MQRVNWTCPGCQKQFAVRSVDGLTVCPECTKRLQNPNSPVVIEQTAKLYKLYQLIGTIILIVGCMISLAGNAWYWQVTNDVRSTAILPSITIGIGLIMLAGGTVLALTGRFLAWWHHG